MGRPDPLESRYEGPWYREAKGLPTKGTAPITQFPEVNKQDVLTPKGFVPSLGPLSGAVTATRQDDRQDTDHYTYPYNNRKHEAPSRRQEGKQPKRARVVYRGPPRGGGRAPAPS